MPRLVRAVAGPPSFLVLVAGALALAEALGPAATRADGVYAFEWRSYSRLTSVRDGGTVTRQGELHGRGRATLRAVEPGFRDFRFEGEGGSGGGVVGPFGPQDLAFPTAVPVGVPPPPPHLTGGSFEVSGDPADPAGFEIDYAEGFICRTTPEGCEGVDSWERFFTGRGRRLDDGGSR